ncbi:MAG: hypothetical protein IJF67_06505 [Clostridia bacterium]|nr:hypothetical protein [Clostridia bacterium]
MRDFVCYHVGGKYDRTMPADGAIFEMNENGGEINIALTDMTAEEIRAVHEGELAMYLSEIDGIVFVTAVFDGALAFDMPFNSGLYPEWNIEDPAPYGYFYLIAAVERRTNVITALRAGAFDPQFSAKLYALAKRQWADRIEDYDEKLAAVYARYSTADIIRRAIARNEVKYAR